jgi:Na+-driven multidrug efflux pump
MLIYGAVDIKWAREDREKGRRMIGYVIMLSIILAILPLFIRWLLGDWIQGLKIGADSFKSILSSSYLCEFEV